MSDPTDDHQTAESDPTIKKRQTMARVRIIARLTPDLVAGLRRVSALEGRSISDIIEEAVGRAFANAGRETEQAAIMARFDSLARQLGVLNRCLETLFELTAHATRFVMSMAPAINPADRPTLNARGGERFAGVMSAIVARLAKGRSVWRDAFSSHAVHPSAPSHAPTIEAAVETNCETDGEAKVETKVAGD